MRFALWNTMLGALKCGHTYWQNYKDKVGNELLTCNQHKVSDMFLPLRRRWLRRGRGNVEAGRHFGFFRGEHSLTIISPRHITYVFHNSVACSVANMYLTSTGVMPTVPSICLKTRVAAPLIFMHRVCVCGGVSITVNETEYCSK